MKNGAGVYIWLGVCCLPVIGVIAGFSNAPGGGGGGFGDMSGLVPILICMGLCLIFVLVNTLWLLTARGLEKICLASLSLLISASPLLWWLWQVAKHSHY